MSEEETKIGDCKHCHELIIKFPNYDWLHMIPDSDDYTSQVTIRTRKHCTTAVAEPPE